MPTAGTSSPSFPWARSVATAIDALEQGRQFAPEFQQQLRRSAREFTVGEDRP